MTALIRTVRFKLATPYAAAFGGILTAVFFLVLAIGERNLRSDFDERLLDRADAMLDKIKLDPSDERRKKRLNPFRFPGYYFQLVQEDGEIIERSRNLGKVVLPFDKRTLSEASDGAPVFRTLVDATAHKLIGSPGEIRLLTRFDARHTEGRSLFLQVAVSLRPVRSAIEERRALLVAIGAFGLLFAAVASWFVAGRALAPIIQVAQVAERLGAHDLTQRFDTPKARDEVATMVLTINRMLDRLEAAFQMQAGFISNVSHELKTPLALLLGNAQLALQPQRSPRELVEFAQQVERNVRALTETVDGLLFIARADAGQIRERLERVSLNEAVVTAVQRTSHIADALNVRLVPTLDRRDVEITGDIELLVVALTNLLRNAVRHSPRGAAVEITARRSSGAAMVSVRDHGGGIPPEAIGRIFDRFFRATHGQVDVQGTRLGLAIVKSIVDVQGGTVTGENHPDGGALFILTFEPASRTSD